MFIVENELPVVLSKGLKLLEDFHSNNAKRFLLTTSFLKSLLSAFNRKDSEETEPSHSISPLNHLVMSVAGKVAKKTECLWGE